MKQSQRQQQQQLLQQQRQQQQLRLQVELFATDLRNFCVVQASDLCKLNESSLWQSVVADLSTGATVAAPAIATTTTAAATVATAVKKLQQIFTVVIVVVVAVALMSMSLSLLPLLLGSLLPVVACQRFVSMAVTILAKNFRRLCFSNYSRKSFFAKKVTNETVEYPVVDLQY